MAVQKTEMHCNSSCNHCKDSILLDFNVLSTDKVSYVSNVHSAPIFMIKKSEFTRLVRRIGKAQHARELKSSSELSYKFK